MAENSHKELKVMASALSAPHFHNEEAAFAYVEARVWPKGAVCPHCGGYDRIGKMGGKSTRTGLYKCYQCRKPFTVRIGTIFESSHVPLHIWLQAMYLVAGSKKGISSNQLHRTLGVTLKTAWFMSHRIREAMRSGDFTPFGTGGTPVEVDETYIGVQNGIIERPKGGFRHKMKVLALVDRATGRSRAFTSPNFNLAYIHPIMRENIAQEARLMTDESPLYKKIGKEFAAHGSVVHNGGQYVKGDVHTNTIEFDFRYSNRVALGYNDADRADALLKGITGKRLTYQTASAR
jgi:transposase-like protein